MADSPGQRLAGIFGPRFRQAMAVPQEDASVKLARLLMGGGQSVTTRATPPALPPFVLPGNALNEAIGPPPIAQQTMPATTVQAPAPTAALPSPTTAVQPGAPPQTVVPPMPAAMQVGPTVQQDVAAAVQQMVDARLLPEQWRGAFLNRFGSAG